jgi:hypothetical protein
MGKYTKLSEAIYQACLKAVRSLSKEDLEGLSWFNKNKPKDIKGGTNE